MVQEFQDPCKNYLDWINMLSNFPRILHYKVDVGMLNVSYLEGYAVICLSLHLTRAIG